MEYRRQPVYDIISIVRIRYYTETVIQIFKTYTETRIRCYIGIISRILTDSYRISKREYRLHLFIESLYNDTRESYLKNIQENFALHSPVYCPNTAEYGVKKTVFAVVLCSACLDRAKVFTDNSNLTILVDVQRLHGNIE